MEAKIIHNRREPWISAGWNYATSLEPRLLPLADEARRLSCYELKAVVIEASMRDVADGLYRSEMKPHAVLQSVFAFQVRYNVPFLFCSDRAGAEYATHSLLAKYVAEIESRMKQLTKAQADQGKAA